MAAIEIDALTRVYAQPVAFDHLALTAAKSEIFRLFGPSSGGNSNGGDKV